MSLEKIWPFGAGLEEELHYWDEATLPLVTENLELDAPRAEESYTQLGAQNA